MLTYDSLLIDLLEAEGLPVSSLKNRFFRLTLRALDEVRKDAPVSTKTVRLDVPANRRVEYPEDLVSVRSVAVQVGSKLYPLHYDGTLSQLPASDSILAEEASVATWPLVPPRPSAWDAWVLAYGVDPVGVVWEADWQWRQGGYSINREERCIYLGPSIPWAEEVGSAPGNIVLVYTGYLTVCKLDSPVDPLLQSYVEEYCLWRYYRSKPDKLSLADRHERRLGIERAKVKEYFDGLDPLAIQQLLAGLSITN
jgi:hypothetical protein